MEFLKMRFLLLLVVFFFNYSSAFADAKDSTKDSTKNSSTVNANNNPLPQNVDKNFIVEKAKPAPPPEIIVWRGNVQANGAPTPFISLILGKKYQIKAKGEINLGKLWQEEKPLAEDACYEYNAKITPIALDSLRNSIGIPLDNKSFNENHTYVSKPFIAKNNGIHFWINNSDYNKSSGALDVTIILLPDDQKK
jgi:hypothetical protein